MVTDVQAPSPGIERQRNANRRCNWRDHACSSKQRRPARRVAMFQLRVHQGQLLDQFNGA
jgi:hypothetical protein